MLNDQEKYRYSRQINLPGICVEGQLRLKQARVLCIGAGGLGSSATLYLAAAGVGCIGIVDDDSVDLSNLPRQILFDENDLNKSKAVVTKEKLEKVNSGLKVICYQEKLNQQNVLDIFAEYDVVIDGTDNFLSKYLINAAAIKLRIPMVFASVLGFEGRVTIFSRESGCYQCLYPHHPAVIIPNCSEVGVLGPLAGTLGCMQALETIKLLIHAPSLKPLINRMLILNSEDMQIYTVNYHKNDTCEICSRDPKDILLPEHKTASCAAVSEITSSMVNLFHYDVLIDVRNHEDFTNGHIQNAINLPLKILEQSVQTDLNPEKSYLVYCHHGIRSQQAVKLLQSSGFNNVTSLRGGYSAWIAKTI